MAKKRKVGPSAPTPVAPDTSKPTAVYRPSGGRTNTLSIALPGSIIANAQSHEQKTYLAGSIARASAVFCVDEIVIFDDNDPNSKAAAAAAAAAKGTSPDHDPYADRYTAFSDPCHFLAHVLSYLETPAYLRKRLFGMQANLRTAGTLPSLDMPHHLRANEWCEFREAVTVSDSPGGGSNSFRSATTEVNTGLPQRYTLPGVHIPAGTRVTVHLNETGTQAEAVAPSTPKHEAGYYWGYMVRTCPSLSAVFTESPYDQGYDVSIGTSERGEAISKALLARNDSNSNSNAATTTNNDHDHTQQQAIPSDGPEHTLIVFGGVAGLEAAAAADPDLREKGVGAGNVSDLFDYWVNVLPGQGSRTIRTEEAVWLGLMGLREMFS